MSDSKRILLVTRNFPPLVGGMEKLNFHVSRALNEKFSLSLAGPRGSSNYHKLEKFTEFDFKPLWKYVISSLFKAVRLTFDVNPQVILCGSGTAAIAGYISAKVGSAKLICYLHGLDIIAPSYIYQNLFVPLIRRFDHIIVNSHHTLSLAVAAGIPSERISILFPGVDLPGFQSRDQLAREFRDKYGLDNRPFLLIAGRLTQRKGIVEFIQNSFLQLSKYQSNLMLVIIGEEAQDAASSIQGVELAIRNVITTHELERKVIFTGRVNDKTLSSAFFAANLFVFPVLDLPDDVEGFGMVAIEAAAHGLPTVGFAVGGVPDAISHGRSGWLIESGAYQDMLECINSYLQSPAESSVSSRSCCEFANQFAWGQFDLKLQKIIDNVFSLQ